MSDYDPDVHVGGVLGGDGLDHHQRVVDQINRQGQGWDFKVHCDGCGRGYVVTVEWREVILIAMKQLPVTAQGERWTFHDGVFWAPVVCPCLSTGHPLEVRLTPDQAQRHVQAGLRSGLLNQAFYQQLTNQVNQQLLNRGKR